LEAAERHAFPTEQILFEVSERERVADNAHLLAIFRHYQELGFRTAIDDFGAGHSGLGLLADFQPDCLKLDRQLISDIHCTPSKQSIVRGVLLIGRELKVEVLAEGVEQREEYRWLFDHGVELFQGYYFARPAFEVLPRVDATCFD
jgi:EAL domain-containing protein (putative c-di-GMP-specific phosphodiesterase class I)